MEGALVDRAVAEEDHRAAAGLLVLAREPHPDADGDLAADDAVAAVEVLRDVEKVHRAALATAAPVDLAEQLRHPGVARHPARERQPVVAVGRDDRVVGARGPHGAGRDGLLADIEVEEPRDLLAPVHLGRALLEAALEQHVAVHRRHVVGGEPQRLVGVARLAVDADVGGVGRERCGAVAAGGLAGRGLFGGGGLLGRGGHDRAVGRRGRTSGARARSAARQR